MVALALFPFKIQAVLGCSHLYQWVPGASDCDTLSIHQRLSFTPAAAL